MTLPKPGEWWLDSDGRIHSTSLSRRFLKIGLETSRPLCDLGINWPMVCIREDNGTYIGPKNLKPQHWGNWKNVARKFTEEEYLEAQKQGLMP